MPGHYASMHRSDLMMGFDPRAGDRAAVSRVIRGAAVDFIVIDDTLTDLGSGTLTFEPGDLKRFVNAFDALPRHRLSARVRRRLRRLGYERAAPRRPSRGARKHTRRELAEARRAAARGGQR